MPAAIVPQVKYGHRHIVNVIEETAKSDPYRTYLSYPKSDNIVDGFNDVSYSQFVNAVNRVAWWLHKSMGSAVQQVTFSYFGPDDPAYPIFIVAAIKCGYRIMLPSPRNSLEYQVSLFKKANCDTVICAQSFVQRLKPLMECELDLCCVIAPALSEILKDDEALRFPYSRSYEDAKKDEFLILHSSGSTGPPKPITYSIECTTTEDAHQNLTEASGKKLWWRLLAHRRNLMGMPCFHSAGVWNCLFFPAWFNSVAVFKLPNRPLSPETAHQIHLYGKVDGGFYPPSVLQGLSKSPEALNQMKRMSFVMYGGGPLDKVSGNAIANVTLLHNFIGYTEGSAPPRYVMPPEDWDYFEYHPDSGMYAEEVEKGIFKVIFRRQQSSTDIQAMFHVFPKLQTYSPGDLVVPHPSKPNLWKHFGRSDDLVVLSTGEKFNPMEMEAIIEQCPTVRSALIYGTGKQNAALILDFQPDLTPNQSLNLMEETWSYVQKANSLMSTQAKIVRSMIWPLPTGNSMERSAKGTIQRQKTFEKFKDQIESLYSRDKGVSNFATGQRDHWLDYHMTASRYSQENDKSVANGNGACEAVRASLAPGDQKLMLSGSIRRPDIKTTVRILAAQACGAEQLRDDEDLFDLGLTSLGVSELVEDLKAELSQAIPDFSSITNSTIYSAGTVSRISTTLLALALAQENRREGPPTEHVLQQLAVPPKEDSVEDVLERLSKDLRCERPRPSVTVAITGTTGGLGCYLLDHLYSNPYVKHIYCLNRGDDSRQRQVSASHQRGLATNWTNTRVSFLQINLSREDLGIKPHQYSMLLREVDYFVHNAWKLDFNCSLHSFEKTHLIGVRNIVNLATYSDKSTRIIFMSSIASVLNWNFHSGPVPEEVFGDSAVAGNTGYAQSKWVAERILQQATKYASVPTTIVRLGQIAGPKNAQGLWSSSDWLPILIRTSKALNALPISLGKMDVVDWVPVDSLAEFFTELVLERHLEQSAQQVYHVVNPHKVSWSCLLPAICHKLGDSVELVSYDAWVSRLEEKWAQRADPEVFPALKLVAWFRDQKSGLGTFPLLDIKRSLLASKTLAAMEPIDGRSLERWMESWGF